VRVDRDDRHACVGVHFGRGHDDRAIDERATESGQVSPLPAGTPALAGPCIGQQLVVGVPEPRAGTLEDLGAEGLELGDQDPDHVRAPGPQTSRDQARLVAKFLDDPSTRAEVAVAMPSRPLITLETVATDTPAAWATSVIVSLRAMEDILRFR